MLEILLRLLNFAYEVFSGIICPYWDKERRQTIERIRGIATTQRTQRLLVWNRAEKNPNLPKTTETLAATSAVWLLDVSGGLVAECTSQTHSAKLSTNITP